MVDGGVAVNGVGGDDDGDSDDCDEDIVTPHIISSTFF